MTRSPAASQARLEACIGALQKVCKRYPELSIEIHAGALAHEGQNQSVMTGATRQVGSSKPLPSVIMCEMLMASFMRLKNALVPAPPAPQRAAIN